jgi:hypothetical protein
MADPAQLPHATATLSRLHKGPTIVPGGWPEQWSRPGVSFGTGGALRGLRKRTALRAVLGLLLSWIPPLYSEGLNGGWALFL